MPDEIQGRASKPHPHESPPNPRPTASDAPTPLGTLSILPRELRDEIYRHVHDHEYYTSNFMGENCGKWRSRNDESLGLPMMTLSKSIRQEFLAVLCGKAVFVLDSTGRAGETTWERKRIPFVDQILNVRYIASLIHPSMPFSELSRILRDPRIAKKFLSERSAKPVEFFTGTEVLRNNCSIELHSVTRTVIPVLQSPLIVAIKGLTGFKILTLKLRLDAWNWSRNDVLIFYEENQSYADQIVGLRGTANAFRSALEPSLGPTIISENYDKGIASFDFTFHPRDYVADRNKGKAISSNLGDEGKGSFPQMDSS